MALLSVFEIVVNFVQYLGIVASVEIPWPASWAVYLEWVRYLKFDLSIPIPELNIPTFPFRAYHLLLTHGLPLAVSIILLLLFKPIKIVVWYVLILGFSGILIAGLVVSLLPSKIPILTASGDLGRVAMIIGSAGLGSMVVAWLLNWSCRIYRRRSRQIRPTGSRTTVATNGDEESMGSVPDVSRIEKGEQYKSKRFWVQVRNVALGAVCLVIGLIGARFVNLSSQSSGFSASSMIDAVLSQIGFVAGLILVVVGSILLYNWLSNLFYYGRLLNTTMNTFFRQNFLKTILLLLSFLYIPITDSLFSSVYCKEVTCPVNTEFPPTDFAFTTNSFAQVFLQTNQTTCTGCFLNPQTCPIASRLCPSVTDTRLIKDESISCSADIYPFYLPGSLLLMFSLTLGVPYLFYKIITICKRFLDEIPIQGSPREKWLIQVYFSKNSCRSLYADFSHEWRYYKLILLVQKLLVVGVFIYGSAQPILVLLALAVSHVAFAGLSIFSRPYKAPALNLLAVLTLLVNAVNAVCAFMVAFGLTIPDSMFLPLALLNTAAPGLFLVYAIVADCLYHKHVRRKARVAVKKKADEKRAMEAAQRVPPIQATAMIYGTMPDMLTPAQYQQMALAQQLPPPLGKLEDSYNTKNFDENTELTPEEKKTHEFVRNLDVQLNKHLLKVFVNFFLFLGFTAFLAICVVLTGFLYRMGDSNYIDQMSHSNPAKFELAGQVKTLWNFGNVFPPARNRSSFTK